MYNIYCITVCLFILFEVAFANARAVLTQHPTFQINGRDVGFQTTKEGEFWRILLPGIYTMEVFAEGYHPKEVQFAVIEQNPTLLNITMQSSAQANRRRLSGQGRMNAALERRPFH